MWIRSACCYHNFYHKFDLNFDPKSALCVYGSGRGLGPSCSGGADPPSLDLLWTAVLWDRVGQGGLGGRSPPSLDLHWTVKTCGFVGPGVALECENTWFEGLGVV